MSLIAEIYSYPKDEYIVFSEFLLGEKRVDFAIFSGRSTMDVTFIEIKGADFNLKKRGHYDSLNSKIEEANSQIRNHRKYIYDDYKSIREKLHDIRKKQNQEITYVMLFYHRRSIYKLIQIKMLI